MSVAAVASWRLEVGEGSQIEVGDGFERLGCDAVAQTVGSAASQSA
jgi:hypothetical protein